MDKTRTVLLVEDNPDDRFFFSAAVRQSHLPLYLQAVGDGLQAVDYLEGNGKFGNGEKYPVPDIIVLDLNLPNMDGFEFLTWRSTSRFLSIPVVALAGDGNENQRQRAQQMGAILSFDKPCALERLCDIVGAICAVCDTACSARNPVDARPRP